ncbi:MAG TPA: 2-amino-4-hydroxy-6-hydroxymethyldihydropteridine diphosphokinase [Gemmatales bacterium]|nr:2-amino-4-hydroxy-6-hydroxymethyldihydropteridine diphosphokinase [Gemmatales bacterium]
MPTLAYIALGSNLGDRAGYLTRAIERLRQEPGIVVKSVSTHWETTPVGGPAGQGAYLNAAACLETELSPQALLKLLLLVEAEQERLRTDRFGPRTLDLDILLYGDLIVREEQLTIPHPRMHERGFMLGPLAEIAPQAVHPVFHRTIAQLLSELGHRPLLGKRALVTGASSGIGRAIALTLAEQGADVIVHARRSKDALEKTAQDIRSRGRFSYAVLADLSDQKQCEQLATDAWNHWQGLEILVCNAGTDILTGAGKSLDFMAKLQALLQVDVISTMLLARTIGSRMKEVGQGVILTMGWDQAETGFGGDSGELFCTAKAAVMAFTRSLSLNLAPQVRVNCLAPGWIKTSWGEQAPADWQERAVREAPLRRWGISEDVARTAAWLAGPDAVFITGQIVRINGGVIRG